MKPSVSRMVHYVSYGTPGGEYASACRAAVVTEVTATYVRQAGRRHEDAPLELPEQSPRSACAS